MGHRFDRDQLGAVPPGKLLDVARESEDSPNPTASPEYWTHSTTTTPSDMSAMTRLRIGTFCRRRKRADRKFADDGAPLFDPLENLFVVL
jgi:hypothetical protein